MAKKAPARKAARRTSAGKVRGRAGSSSPGRARKVPKPKVAAGRRSRSSAKNAGSSTRRGKPARTAVPSVSFKRTAGSRKRAVAVDLVDKTRRASKIVPHLWFDAQAREASEFYASLFPDSGIDSVRTIRGTPSGDCDVVSFHLAGQDFMAISAGPLFRFNPSISFFLNFDPSKDKKARQNLDATWKALAKGGKVLMELQEYPFSKRYGWLQDRYGVPWQLILTDPAGEPRPFIVPSLMFVGGNVGRAEEALRFYTSVFKGSRTGNLARYPKGMGPDKEGTLMFGDFRLEGQWFAAMDSAQKHDFAFNEAVSLVVRCEDQGEIDSLWSKMSAAPGSEQCGWLKDRFGVSWQIVPAEMEAMMQGGTQEQVDRVTQAFLPMKKLEVAPLREAYAGKRRAKVPAA